MSIVNFSELRDHSVEHRYGLILINIHSLTIARAIIGCAVKLDSPLVMSVQGSHLQDGLLPSLEMMARQASIPVALLAKSINNVEQAIAAIRLGCNGLILSDDLSETRAKEIREVSASCGIPLMHRADLSTALVEIDAELELTELLQDKERPYSWSDFDRLIARAAEDCAEVKLRKAGSTGQGLAALKACRLSRSVEHLIVYNTTLDESAAEELAFEGRRVLDKIPGVRATWSGRALQSDARYRWCWLIRFAHPAVIDSYRIHPDHVAYADNHFRPYADDRISIDYELMGPEEGTKARSQY